MNPSIDHGSFIVGLLRSVGARLSGLFGSADRVEPLVRPPDDDDYDEVDVETLRRLGITAPGIYAVCDDDVAGPCESSEAAMEAWIRKYGVHRVRFIEVTQEGEADPSPCGSDVRDCSPDDTACNPKEPA